MQLVTSEELEQMKANGDKILVDFYASWCGPCKMLAKNMETANLELPVEVIDIDVNSEVATDYGIRSVPTLVMLDGNIEVKRMTGVKTVNELQAWANE